MQTLDKIAQAATRRDRDAFAELVRKTTPTVYRLALRYLGSESDAADVVQDTYIRCWENIDRLRDHKAALGWICRICRNLCTDELRSRRRKPLAPVEEPVDFLDPLELVASAQANDRVWRMVQSLRDKHRVVLLLHVVDGMSNEEMAIALGCPIGTIESRLHRARQELASRLERAARRAKEGVA